MSRRVRILIPDDEYLALDRVAQRRGQSVSRVVRESLRHTLAEGEDDDPERRIAALRRFARFAGPTGDIEDVLAVIERGR